MQSRRWHRAWEDRVSQLCRGESDPEQMEMSCLSPLLCLGKHSVINPGSKVGTSPTLGPETEGEENLLFFKNPGREEREQPSQAHRGEVQPLKGTQELGAPPFRCPH